MSIVEDGPIIPEEWTGGAVIGLIVAIIIASDPTLSTGASVQKSGNFGEAAALVDQLAGKVGPMVGEWRPEKGSRLIQEF